MEYLIKIPMLLPVTIGLILTICIYLIDGYKYPICPSCGNNGCCKRIKGRIVCDIHGDVTDAVLCQY